METILKGKIDDEAPQLPLTGYMTYAAIGIIYFLVQHAILHVLIKTIYPKYLCLQSREFHDYRMQVNAVIHAIAASLFSFYCLF